MLFTRNALEIPDKQSSICIDDEGEITRHLIIDRDLVMLDEPLFSLELNSDAQRTNDENEDDEENCFRVNDVGVDPSQNRNVETVQLTENTVNPHGERVSPHDFQLLKVLGKGGYGKVSSH